MRTPVPTMIAAALLATLAVSAAPPAHAQAPGQTIEVGGWKISNSKNAAGLQTCVSIYIFDDKSIVGFSADTEGTTTFLFSEPDAKLTEGKQYPVSYKVDKDAPTVGTGVATSAEMLVVPEPNPDVMFSKFIAGNALFVTVAGKTFEEPLDGSGDAIKALASCVKAAVANK